MTEQHDSMTYREAKRTNPIRDGGVVIGTMPTKYPQFFTDDEFIAALPFLRRQAAIRLAHKMNADAGLTPDGEYRDIDFPQHNTQGDMR